MSTGFGDEWLRVGRCEVRRRRFGLRADHAHEHPVRRPPQTKWVEYGPEKMERMFAHRSFLDHGIPVATASD